MFALIPYLIFDGKAEEAFMHYRTIFGGEFAMLSRFSDSPDGEHLPEEEKTRIMHITYPLKNGFSLMASDSLPSKGQCVSHGLNVQLSVNAESEEEATHIFKGLSEGGTVDMPMQKTFWGAYFGMCADKFGIRWMVNYDYQPNDGQI